MYVCDSSINSVGKLLSWVVSETCAVLTELERLWVSGQRRPALAFHKKTHNVFIYCRASPSAFPCTRWWLKWWRESRHGCVPKHTNSSNRNRFLRAPLGKDGNILQSGVRGESEYVGVRANAPRFKLKYYKFHTLYKVPCCKANRLGSLLV